jgi:hypothetical protein
MKLSSLALALAIRVDLETSNDLREMHSLIVFSGVLTNIAYICINDAPMPEHNSKPNFTADEAAQFMRLRRHWMKTFREILNGCRENSVRLPPDLVEVWCFKS